MNLENIIINKKEDFAIVVINRPKKLNALNKATIQELHLVFKNLEEDEAIRAIILTGRGDKAFVAGADIAEFAHFSEIEGANLAREGQEIVFTFIENLKTPVIAAINGFALGGGLELAMACHFRIASNNAKMGLPEVSLGLIPGYGGTQRLPQLVGKGKAMELILTAKMITAEEAKNCGLVNYAIAQEELLPFTEKIIKRILQNSATAISAAIQSINTGFIDATKGFDTEIKQFGNCFGTKDFKEGTTAFLEKRKPNF